jgi:DNA-binding MarR family transcriptional regulator
MSIMIDNKTKQFLATSLKGVLNDTLEWMENRNAELRKGSEFEGTAAEAKLFATLRGRPRSISELARVMGLSRQAVHTTVHKLVKAGVIDVVTSDTNRRDKMVRITVYGQQVQRMAAKNLRQIETDMARSIGRDNVELIRSLLMQHLESVRR